VITMTDPMIQVVDWLYPSEPRRTRTATACNAKPACSKRCTQFLVGVKIGRDLEPSCLTCTHSAATHRQPKTKKAAKR
jgi:hypothetical protein